MFQTIPLNKLVASPRNVRRHTDAAADAELKASIAAHGLLQNLVVRAGAKGKFEVEAGERRRRAMLALAEDKVLPRDHAVTCLVLSADNEAAPEASLAENFHRLAMNPADEAQAFAALIEGGATTELVARRFGLTVRFVEGRLRLATLAPVVFDALAAGEITLDMAKAYGATSDQQIQARVFTEISGAYYSPTPDSIRRMVLTGTVRGSDPRARLVGRDAYVAAGGRIERELFDNADTESWVDVALLESLAAEKMAEEARTLAEQNGLAWVKPTLDPYASHDLVEGLVRLPAEPAPLSEAETARLEELDASWDEHAAVLEDEDSAPEAIEAAEAAIAAIERETQDIRNRPPVLPDDHKGSAGMILTLSREGKPVLQPVFYGERNVAAAEGEDSIEVVSSDGEAGPRRATLSRRLVDELAMQRRDVLALHLASDPALALDVMVFTLADADSHDWQARTASTIRGGLPSGPLVGFEPADAAATRALVELRAGLDETWRSGRDQCERFDRFRALPDEARAAWLGHVVARSLEASLNMSGERRVPFQDHLGALIGIDIAQWWRPTAANYFDRVPKQVILEALGDVGGAELASRYMSVKKSDLAASAERIFAGATIAEVAERERALAWVPDVMRFGGAAAVDDQSDVDKALAEDQQPDPSDGMANAGPSEASPCDLAA
ncbi:ParB/RepB/Spo0J family partition protein [Novosphingobium sp. FKTRR1]|uniref:ParB/RepB/Spo0J family partition protein n=1 Tax=Novosphingobium sp. FKTRR1 TaxID=2879118 RepID=UPI001CF0A19B|nr:ParB/RepB/Spo0J family partition protein [Novosphingobium sp. FKTRR1]